MQYRDGDGDGDGYGDGDMPANTIEWVNAIGVGNLRKGKGVGQPILAWSLKSSTIFIKIKPLYN